MAKKSKKSRKARSTRKAPTTSFDRPVSTPKPAEGRVSTVREAVAPVTARTAKRGEQVDFRKEYYYVLKDLRLLGIIAAVMLVVLLVLSAFI